MYYCSRRLSLSLGCWRASRTAPLQLHEGPRHTHMLVGSRKGLTVSPYGCVGVMQQQGPRDFAQVLKHLFSGDQTDEPDPDRFRWSDLSDMVAKYFKPASGVSCMLGPMEAEAKVRKAPQRRQPKAPLGDVRRAEEVPEQAGDKQV
jgi:hypothetical protein